MIFYKLLSLIERDKTVKEDVFSIISGSIYYLLLYATFTKKRFDIEIELKLAQNTRSYIVYTVNCLTWLKNLKRVKMMKDKNKSLNLVQGVVNKYFGIIDIDTNEIVRITSKDNEWVVELVSKIITEPYNMNNVFDGEMVISEDNIKKYGEYVPSINSRLYKFNDGLYEVMKMVFGEINKGLGENVFKYKVVIFEETVTTYFNMI